MAGEGGQIGATGIFDTARELERALRDGQTDRISSLFERVTMTLDTAVQALQSLPPLQASGDLTPTAER